MQKYSGMTTAALTGVVFGWLDNPMHSCGHLEAGLHLTDTQPLPCCGTYNSRGERVWCSFCVQLPMHLYFAAWTGHGACLCMAMAPVVYTDM